MRSRWVSEGTTVARGGAIQNNHMTTQIHNISPQRKNLLHDNAKRPKVTFYLISNHEAKVKKKKKTLYNESLSKISLLQNSHTTPHNLFLQVRILVLLKFSKV